MKKRTKLKRKKKRKEKDPFSERVSNAFKTAYKATDLLLSYGKDESSRVRWSGCSGLTCIIQNTRDPADIDGLFEQDEDVHSTIEENEKEETPRKPKPPVQLGLIHLANAGNVHALLVRDNKAYMLSKDHTPKNPKELSRVIKEGGTVNDSKKEPRVNGVLATTRGIGNHGDPALKKVVLNEPYATTVKIDQYAQYLVMASHGLWEVFNEHEVADLVVQMLPQNAYPAPSVCSTSINLLLAEYHRDLQSRMYAATYTEDAIKSGKYSVASSENQSRPNTGKLSTISKDSYKTTNTTVSSIPNSKKSVGKTQDSHSVILEQDEANGSSPISSGPNQNINLALCDLQTEVGSQIYVSDDEREDDSGNEGDIDTCTDFVSIPAHSRLTGIIPTKAELHREFSRMISERLVQAALLAGAKDNITAMVIMLPGCGL
ncbi:unnamed protein product [Owenia fusiformis]|uniref:Uncharacterized protein n=1 Tax=Owenia fusiformis TaxID=6347 RepID=A0A8J1XPZ3_OWEFU|nr:unnamed protein product [Owenia fusiformis]